MVLWDSMVVDSNSWSRVVPALAVHRTLYLVDGPSSGDSDPLDRASDIAGCSDAAAQVLEALREQVAGPVDWVGNAWDGHVEMYLAATHPELIASLVAISAPITPDPSMPKPWRY